MKIVYILIVIQLVVSETHAQVFQKVSALLDTPYDSVYIEDFEDKLLIKPIVAFRSFTFDYAESSTFDFARFKPAGIYFAGIGGAYKNLQLQLILPIAKVINTDMPEDIKATDINLAFKTNTLSGKFFYRRYEGVLIQNSELLSDKYTKAVILKTGLKGFYNFSKHYSVNASYKQTQSQKKSAAAFLLGIDYFYTYTNFPDSAVSGLILPNYTPTHTLNFPFGLAYNLSLKEKWYLAPVAFVGPGVQLPANLGFSEARLSYLYDLRLSVGYNGKKWVYGIIAEYERNRLLNPDFIFGTQALYLKFNVALRIGL